MSVVIVTGSGGLIGSEAALYFAGQGHDIVGIDNDMRATFFGVSTAARVKTLQTQLGRQYAHYATDIRNAEAINGLFAVYRQEIALVIHAAAQPSHDWAAKEPVTDFGINAVGTLNLLEATRQFAPEAVFIFTSTNKVYGDRPNGLALVERPTRYEPADPSYWDGINEQMSIDQSMHSLFGASKVAADVLVQEYGRYFELKTGVFRGGCLTGVHHAGAEQHGFLAYLAMCVREGKPYTVYGYKGKQVRDNIHAADVCRAMDAFYREPRRGVVYNLGGGRGNSCSVLEAITHLEVLSGKRLDWRYDPQARRGDHQWYITDMSKFQGHYPGWSVTVSLHDMMREMIDNREIVTA